MYVLIILQVKLFLGKSVVLNLDYQAKSHLFDEEFAITVEDWQKDISPIIAELPQDF